MKTEHVNFLHETLKYLGFGVNTPLNNALDEQLSREPDAFTLHTEVSFDGETMIEATLFFKRGKGEYTDRYFFNKYDAVLRFLDRPGEERKLTVQIERNRRGITFKQAFNLLQGRYVQRKVVDQNSETHDWWLHLEFKVRAVNGNPYLRYYKGRFDLEKALDAVCQVALCSVSLLQVLAETAHIVREAGAENGVRGSAFCNSNEANRAGGHAFNRLIARVLLFYIHSGVQILWHRIVLFSPYLRRHGDIQGRSAAALHGDGGCYICLCCVLRTQCDSL